MNFTKVIIFTIILSALLFLVAQSAECPKGCSDVPPPPAPRQMRFSCAQQKMFGQCNADFMMGYCDCTCGTCDKLLDSIMMTGPMME